MLIILDSFRLLSRTAVRVRNKQTENQRQNKNNEQTKQETSLRFRSMILVWKSEWAKVVAAAFERIFTTLCSHGMLILTTRSTFVVYETTVHGAAYLFSKAKSEPWAQGDQFFLSVKRS